ncbi:MAG: hypothetical protein IJ139_10295 [Bacteroidaceae bacterium]|nr:hypothetical protein [Bacteroidaceae bacterium]
MIVYLMIVVVFGPLVAFLLIRNDRKKRAAWERRYPSYHPSSLQGIWPTKIGNIRYHCNRDDIGVVVFAVKPDAGNVYHRSSMAIIRDDGKQLGYIGKREAAKFNRWCGGNPCSGMGMIQYDEKTNKLWADIFVFSPRFDEQQLATEVQAYISWVSATYGVAYIPERYRP